MGYRIDSLNLFQYESQENFYPALHQPHSFYVVEQKKEGKYNQFSFKTYFPIDESEKNKYSELEQFIMDEFQWEFKMK
ncbi:MULTISPECIES: hypothetical protein [Flavobacterium]|uniref:Uncharacterized protein n=1 Tax=Flavobacterium jumunjinense TaxID=998845 RepID=A0ABV5GU33_9FLAO|nr:MULTISPECIES: hypothetical protein [Flavobacterium]